MLHSIHPRLLFIKKTLLPFYCSKFVITDYYSNKGGRMWKNRVVGSLSYQLHSPCYVTHSDRNKQFAFLHSVVLVRPLLNDNFKLLIISVG